MIKKKLKTPKKKNIIITKDVDVIPPTKKYKIEIKFNGLNLFRETNNLDKTILEFKPEVLYTEVYVTVFKGNESAERRLNLRQGKNLFINEDFRKIFINNLLLD